MIGRPDIEGSKGNVAVNAWLPQANYPCGIFSDTSLPPSPSLSLSPPHDGLQPAHVPYWRANNPTLWDFCGSMIGRPDIEGSKGNVAVNAWLPQASYPLSPSPSLSLPPFPSARAGRTPTPPSPDTAQVSQEKARHSPFVRIFSGPANSGSATTISLKINMSVKKFSDKGQRRPFFACSHWTRGHKHQ